jgi:hypothetical protein
MDRNWLPITQSSNQSLIPESGTKFFDAEIERQGRPNDGVVLECERVAMQHDRSHQDVNGLGLFNGKCFRH